MSSHWTSDIRHAGLALMLLAAGGLLSSGALAQAEAPEATAAIRVGEPHPATPVDTVLDGLVADALAANRELESANASVAQRLAALDQARARYLPTLDLDLRYSRADGGREIEFPIGDLLNPAYASLNTLLTQQGLGAPFGTVDNQRFTFLREREQESKLVLNQPLYDARIGAGSRLGGAELDRAREDRQALAGRVVRDMKQAYLRWLRAQASVQILDASLELARSNLRVNESLFRNGKITRDLVYRAEADVLEIEQSRLSVQNGVALAQGYVNLLRAQPLDTPLPATTVTEPDIARLGDGLATAAAAPTLGLAALQTGAIERRAELPALDAALAAAKAGEDAAKAAFKPRLGLNVEGGVQGEDYGFGSDERYAIASLVLRFNFFNGGADRAALREARARGDQLRATRALAAEQIRLEVLDTLQAFEVAQASLQTASKRVEAAAGAFRIAARKRDLGQINQTEFIDARRALTDAQLNQNLTRFDALSNLAQLEYAIGLAASRLPTESSP